MHLATTCPQPGRRAGPRFCGSRSASRSCPRLRASRARRACPASRRAARKLASRFFASRPRVRAWSEPTQSLNTHQGSAAYWYGIASGCVVDPNSGYDAVCNLSYTRDGGASSAASAKQFYGLVVTLPDGTQYMPISRIKNQGQADLLGGSIGGRDTDNRSGKRSGHVERSHSPSRKVERL